MTTIAQAPWQQPKRAQRQVFSQFQRKAQVYLRMILVCVYDSTHAAAFMVLQQFSFIVGRLVRPVQPAVVFASQRYAG
ncbi:hypothetical protein ACF8PL_19245 [Delftia sp. WSY_4]|uniref:Uncharacterized protein n=1 Tax=Delftia lacustris TaxID=558537 RepID=A0A7T2YV81_9BURK|nr:MULTISPECIES: hypothetical protein [Delftia]MDH0421700.1 hypothetical protein [Delftia tsuruhatensis]MPT03989.1 hypothetical protein [Delftia sp.]QPS81708.1 hypothetical protein I6G47_01085 [Delftia lacustris]